MVETLEVLRKTYPLALVTAGSKERVLRELAENGLAAYFPVVVTGGDVLHPKPAPDGIQLALEKLGIESQECIYVGDTSLDFETAMNAGVRFIGIPSRYASLPPGTPGARLKQFSDLPDWLSNSV